MLTPPDPKRFLLTNQLAELQAHNAVDAYARQATPVKPPMIGNESETQGPTFAEVVEELRRLKQRDAEHEAKILGLRNMWPDFYRTYHNPNCLAVEKELGFHILGDPLPNYVQNGGFRDWNSGVTLPTGWTATGTATLSRQTRRTGARLENYACRIATAGATGGFSQAIAGIQLGNIFTLGLWVNLAGANDTLTVDIVTAGASTNLAASYLIDAAVHGSGGWFFVPGPKIKGMNNSFLVPSDATSCTVTFTAGLNSTVDVSDVQVVIGPECNPNLWAPYPGDLLPQPLNTTDSPEFNAVTLNGTTPLVIEDASNGGSRQIVKVIEEVTISAAGTGTTFTLTLPAYSKVLRISSYVRVTVPAPATQITGIVDALGNNFLANVASYAPTAGNSDVGNRGCPYYVDNASAQTVQIIMDFTPATNAGRVRVVAEYETITPPTS